jgi:hypothetical protein
MDTKSALKWGIYYRLAASGSFVLGMAITFFGVSAGLGETVQILFTELGNSGAVDEAMAAANVPLAALSLVAGLLVWQIGKSAAFFWTLSGAVDAETGATDDTVPPDTAAPTPETPRDPVGGSGPESQPGPGIGASGANSQENAQVPADAPGTAEGPDERASPTPDTGTRTGSPTAHEDEAARTGTAPGDAQTNQSVDTSSDAPDETTGTATAGTDRAATAVADEDTSAAFDDASGDDTEGVTCGDCGHANKESVSFCMNCGAEL